MLYLLIALVPLWLVFQWGTAAADPGAELLKEEDFPEAAEYVEIGEAVQAILASQEKSA